MLAHEVPVLSERSRVTLVDVKDFGEPTVFQNDDSKFYEWAKKIEVCVIGVEPHLEPMFSSALENDPAIRQSMIADKFGENGDPTEQVDGYAQVVVQLKTVLTHVTEGESWLIVQNCTRKTVLKRGEVDTHLLIHSLVADVGICCPR